MSWRVLMVLGAASVASACVDGEIGGPAKEPTSVVDEPPTVPPLLPVPDEDGPKANPDATVQVQHEGDAGLFGAPPRGRRRMDIDQINATLRHLTGLGWTTRQGTSEVDLFERYAQTLGRPDYLEQVNEDLTPSPLFYKFLDDAARSVCASVAARDISVEPQHRVLMLEASPGDSPLTETEKATANLQYLLKHFHGVRLGASSPDLTPWRTLLERAYAASNDAPRAWTAVCVGLVTHPNFYVY